VTAATTAAEPTFALIAGGGTAGHLLPGIAVANELVRRGHPKASLHFVGAARGVEASVVPEAGFDVTLLPGRGIQRRLTLENLGSVLGLARAAWRAIVLVGRRRPQVVLVLGGFASAACGLAAVLRRVPIVVVDQNARAGAVNRMLGRFAAASAVPFAATDLPRAVLTGNPVRAQVLDAASGLDRQAAIEELGVPGGRRLVGVFAGSLGSRRINEATRAAAEGPWRHRGDLAVYHVVGARDWAELGEDAGGEATEVLDDGGPEGLWYRRVRYDEHIERLLVAADLVVCRAGGTTVAELAITGTPAVLVPLPIATRDHQRANASELVKAGAAVLVPDDELDAGRLVEEVDGILSDPARPVAMADAARSLGRPDAAAAVADIVEEAATGRRR
jgi:undecaprenyldiphospho-muramoylpentapeptide beta-N-acetylglucosaminyltransferase